MLFGFPVHVFCQKVDESVVFEVKKKQTRPTQVNWIGGDTLKTNELYELFLGKLIYDSLSFVNLKFKKTKGSIIFGRENSGKAYVIVWVRNRKTGELKQTYVKPMFFKNKKE